MVAMKNDAFSDPCPFEFLLYCNHIQEYCVGIKKSCILNSCITNFIHKKLNGCLVELFIQSKVVHKDFLNYRSSCQWFSGDIFGGFWEGVRPKIRCQCSMVKHL